MSDRAEQAKALIEKWKRASKSARKSEHHFAADSLAEAAEVIEEWAAALTAAEAEVTRLETGIVEALEFVDGRIRGKYMREVSTRLTALSQPTTDANGARA